MTDKELKELVKMSRLVGKDAELINGVGGNTSIKTKDGFMYIKASGTALKDMTIQRGWRRIRLENLSRILADKTLLSLGVEERNRKMSDALLKACDDKQIKTIRPSIETWFHSILGRCVIHLHPPAVLAYVCAKSGQQQFERLFKNYLSVPLWVPYTELGFTSAKKIAREITKYNIRYGKSPEIIFMQNHGVIISSQNLDKGIEFVRKVVSRCKAQIKCLEPVKFKKPSKAKITQAISIIKEVVKQKRREQMQVRHFLDGQIAAFFRLKNAEKLCKAGAITPEESLISHGAPIWIGKDDVNSILSTLKRRFSMNRHCPLAILIKPLGLFVIGSENATDIKNVVSFHLPIRGAALKMAGIRHITAKQRDLLTHI